METGSELTYTITISHPLLLLAIHDFSTLLRARCLWREADCFKLCNRNKKQGQGEFSEDVFMVGFCSM